MVSDGLQGADHGIAEQRHLEPVVRERPGVGKPGAKETLPEKLQAKEGPNDRRKLSESICEGPFRF